jgi:hypothetical protein
MANTIATGVAYADPEFVSVQVGNSAVPVAVTSSGIINGAYATTSATSGDTRLTYQRLTFSSTGSGETIRAFSVVTGAGAATGGTINGAHVSLSVNGVGTISGAVMLCVLHWAAHRPTPAVHWRQFRPTLTLPLAELGQTHHLFDSLTVVRARLPICLTFPQLCLLQALPLLLRL